MVIPACLVYIGALAFLGYVDNFYDIIEVLFWESGVDGSGGRHGYIIRVHVGRPAK